MAMLVIQSSILNVSMMSHLLESLWDWRGLLWVRGSDTRIECVDGNSAVSRRLA
jgi:hypothetical protein